MSSFTRLRPRRSHVAFLCTMMLLSACSAQKEAPAKAPVREPAPPVAVLPSDPLRPDQCSALDRQSWVGQSVDTLSAPPPGEAWRVVCTSCARTDDFRADRLNVEYDEASRRIVKVSCG